MKNDINLKNKNLIFNDECITLYKSITLDGISKPIVKNLNNKLAMKKRSHYAYLQLLTVVSAFLILFSSCKQQDQQDICDSDIYEPNESFNTAYNIGSVEENSKEIDARISNENDLDFYKIIASEVIRFGYPDNPEYFRIRFKLTPPPGKDYDLYIYDDSNSLLDYSVNRGNMEETIDYFWTGKIMDNDEKEFFIEVRTFSRAWDCKDYTISVTMSYSSDPW